MSRSSEDWAIVLAAICTLLIGGALILEHAFAFAPCPLCLMQRVWVIVVGAFALIGLSHNPRLGIYPLLTIVSATAGGYFSIKQLWLQSLPVDQVPACGPGLEYLIENLPLGDVLSAMTNGTGDCAEVVFAPLGIALPGWALIGFVVLIGVAGLQWRRSLRG